MSNSCPFCGSEVARIGLSRLDLRICPECLATFFPSDRTMTFRRELFRKTRETWLAVLNARKANFAPKSEAPCCIDCGKPLERGKLPDYALDGWVATCCGMFNLDPQVASEVLARTLAGSEPQKEGKHHFAFIRLLDKLVTKLTGNELPEDDPIETLQYELHFRDVLEPKP